MSTPTPNPSAFVLADRMQALDYNLGDYGGTGTVPEPSQDTIDAWSAEMAVITAEAQITVPPNATPTEIAEFVVNKSKTNAGLNRRAVDAYARLCGAQEAPNPSRAKSTPKTVWKGGSPTHQELTAMPWRVRAVFFAWLSGELNPERAPAATSS